MTVNLDVLMYLARIALAIAGVIALVYLAMLFKSVIDTMKTFSKTLEAVNRDLVKLESPLNTIGQVSNTVDQVSDSAKKAAMGAIKVFSEGTTRLGSKMNQKSEGVKRKSTRPETEPDVQLESQSAPAADFQPVGIVKEEVSAIVTEETQTRPEQKD